MGAKYCDWCKIITLCLIGGLNVFLFCISFRLDYEKLVTEEHVRFRRGFPSQANWVHSPFGRLHCYLFNVTNSEAFLNGTDTKIKLQEVGPITYKIKGFNNVLDQSDSHMIFSKLRHHEVEFDPISSCDPDILNKTIILPNVILLGAAAKVHDWVFLVRHVINAVTINEPPFLKQTIYYFLWDFKTPALNLLSTYLPNIQSNCGILHNALGPKPEVYDINIGLDRGVENFFRVKTLNNKTYFPQHEALARQMDRGLIKVDCPVKTTGAFDNSIFPPNLRIDDEIRIIAPEACRTHRLVYNETVSHLGFQGYRYKFDMTPNCLDSALGIDLYDGMFDVSSCLINDVPSAFSAPHFFGTNYNWEEHFEGLSPNAEQHETSIIVEPTTGITIEENYRFQSSVVMPNMKGYNSDLEKFAHMVVPSFWYEYDLDDLPASIQFLMRLNVYVVPIAKPILMTIYLIISIYCFIKLYQLYRIYHVKVSS